MFKVHFVNARSAGELQTLLGAWLAPVVDGITSNGDTLRYLDATACVTLDPTRSFNIPGNLRSGYPAIFGQVFRSQELTESLFIAIAPWRVEKLTGSGDWQITTILDAAAVEQAAPDLDTADAEVLHGIEIINRCRAYSDVEVIDLTVGSNKDVRRVFDAMNEGDALLKSCFITNTGIAIARASLLARHLPLGPLSIWVQ